MEKVLTQKKEISIFKTSVVSDEQIPFLKDLLDTIIGPSSWNFDLEDKDSILRIEAYTLVNSFLIQEVNKLGFDCEELY